jgi:hypothetical protein
MERAVVLDTSAMVAVDDAASDNTTRPSSDGNLYYGTSEAATEGAEVALGMRSGPLSTIDACEKTYFTLLKIQSDDHETMDAFLRPLADAKILSNSEKELGRSSPKLSRLSKIGEYADRLRDKRIIEFLMEVASDGYMPLYQIAVIFDQTSDGREEGVRIQQVVDTVRSKGAKTLDDLRNISRQMKSEKRGASEKNTNLTIAGLGPMLRPAEPTTNGGIQTNPSYDLVVAVLRRSDERKLREWQASDGHLPRCLQVSPSVTENAAMVVVAPVSAFPVVSDKLLPCCGFEGVSPRVRLVANPADPDVTDALAVFIVSRSPVPLPYSELAWLPADRTLDAIELATRLVPGAKNKLQLFADVSADGWDSIIGNANWGVTDE